LSEIRNGGEPIVRPILFKIGTIPIYSYGFMLSVAILVGVLLAAREARRLNWDVERLMDFYLYAIISGLLFSRILYILLDWQFYLANPVHILYLWEGGLSLHGALLGGVVLAGWYSWRWRWSFWQLADISTPSMALGIAIGRVGCFLRGCCYGIVTDLPWGIHTPLAPGLRHPTQAYESLLALGMFFILWALRKRIKVPGQLFLLFVLMYSVIRFCVELLRESVHIAGWLTMAQLASAIFAALALILFLLRSRCGRHCQ